MRDNRYATVPIIVKIVKVVAVLILLFFLYQAIAGWVLAIAGWAGGAGQFGQQIPATTGFWARLQSLIGPLFSLVLGVLISTLAWGFAELFLMVRQLVLGKHEVAATEAM